MIYNLIHRESKQSIPYSFKCLKCMKYDFKHLFTELSCDHLCTNMMFVYNYLPKLNFSVT